MASTNDIERRLLEIFERILRVRPVGLQDNFFDRGGDSLMAIQLLVLLEKAFDKALPLVSLFEHPTVAELSVLVGDWKRKESPDPVLVEMRSGGSEMPLFFVPGGRGGMAELALYAGLMQHLDGDHSVYGLLAQGLRRQDTPQRTLPERAAAFVGKIRSVQPRGPYALGGECAGGIVAFEMAQQLVAQGQEVALLLLMDTWRPVPTDSLRARYFYKPIEILKNRGSAARGGVSNLLRMLRTFVREQPASGLGSWASYWCSIIRRLGRKTVLWRTAIQNIEQTMRYQPQPYPGEISLLITSHSDREGLVKGWQSLSDRELNVYIVPGDHESYIRETNGVTAQQLQVCLDKSARERHRSISHGSKSGHEFNQAAFEKLRRIAPNILEARRPAQAGDWHARPLPEELAFKLTNRCDLRCTHCYQWNEVGYHHNLPPADKHEDLDLHVIARVLKATRALRSNVYLWGGEPLLYRDWDGLVELLAEDPRWTAVCTNGTLIERRLDSLMKISQHLEVSVSLDGFETEHDSIRGKGSFQRTMRGIRLLVERKKAYAYLGEVTINFVLSDGMVCRMFDFMEFLEQEGIDTVYVSFPWHISYETAAKMDRYYATFLLGWREHEQQLAFLSFRARSGSH